MERVYDAIDKLIIYAKSNLNLDGRNSDYVRNGIFRHLGLDSYKPREVETSDETPEKLLKEFSTACVEAGLFEKEDSEYYCDEVMGELSLMPSDVEKLFNGVKEKEGAQKAISWLYSYCVKNDYVKKAKLDENPRFESDGLIITINKAKPEFRDPKKAQSGNATKGGYPLCSICHANEGFAGRSKRTLRAVDITLGGQDWFWQFSPYGYFREHGIAVNHMHTPMHIDRGTFSRLMDFVDEFSGYFIGCNACLPRIGGSVLAHDHYQGGGEILPMHKAKAVYTLKSRNYPDAIVEVVDWAGTVVRVVSRNRQDIVDISDAIREKWIKYENKELGIIPEDSEGVHSSVSPTVVKTERGYEMSIIFRNNITTDEYPDGVFHAHPEYHIIKKESIGLIEAQGLFILPGRLEKELGELKQTIVKGAKLSDELKEYTRIYSEVKELCGGNFSDENVGKAIAKELGIICNAILDNTAVFKDKKLTVKFIKELGFENE